MQEMMLESELSSLLAEQRREQLTREEDLLKEEQELVRSKCQALVELGLRATASARLIAQGCGIWAGGTRC